MFPRLSDAKIDWLAEQGERRSFAAGEILYEHAQRDAPFYVIDRGLVELVDRKPGKNVHVAQVDARTLLGDIAAFTGEPTLSAAIAVEPTDVIAFDRAGLRSMMARWPELGEHLFATMLARRRVARGGRPRRDAPHRGQGLAARVRRPRPPRAQPAPRPLVRRRHGRRERRDAPLARHPGRGDAGPRPRDAGHAQPVRGAGRAVPGSARGGRRRRASTSSSSAEGRRASPPPCTAARRA